MTEELKQAAVYVGFATFKSAIETLANGVVTNRIDRTTFPGYAGGVQTQLLAGLKFLGLTNGENRPTALLHQLADKDETARKIVLGETLKARYPALFALDLQKTTPGELAEVMGEVYNVNGDTKEKAVRFFIAAATYAGLKVNPLLLKTKGPMIGVRRRRIARRPDEAPDPTPTPATPPVSGTSTNKVIVLRNGGQLTLSANVDVLKLKGDDRAFVFKLIDEIDAFEAAGEVDDADESE